MLNLQRIIIIDDDPIVTSICQYIIKKNLPEVEFVSYTSPVKGVDYIRTEYRENSTNTILFLDINMPILSGWEVLDELQELDRSIMDQITVYMFSSSINIEDKNASLSNPLVKGFIEKPLTMQKLLDVTTW